jgi:hypothetical protein
MTRMTKARLLCQTADIQGSKDQLSRMLTLAETSSVPQAVYRVSRMLVGYARDCGHTFCLFKIKKRRQKVLCKFPLANGKLNVRLDSMHVGHSSRLPSSARRNFVLLRPNNLRYN